MTSVPYEEILTFIHKNSAPDGPLERAKAILRGRNRADLADQIEKFEQDAGLECDPMFDPDDLSAPEGSPQTAAIRAAYTPITRARMEGVNTLVADTLNLDLGSDPAP